MSRDQLKEWRERLGFDMRQMARYVGVSYHAWRSWELEDDNGGRRPRGAAVRLLELLQQVEMVCPAVHEMLIQEVKA